VWNLDGVVLCIIAYTGFAKGCKTFFNYTHAFCFFAQNEVILAVQAVLPVESEGLYSSRSESESLTFLTSLLGHNG